MNHPLLPLCEQSKPVIKDGYVGAYAQLTLPFVSYIWFANGDVPTFPSSTLAQDQSKTFSGQRKPNTFKKDCCTC